MHLIQDGQVLHFPLVMVAVGAVDSFWPESVPHANIASATDPKIDHPE